MKKIVLSLLSILSLLSPVLYLLHPTLLHACPAREPSTLLSLYQASESIHVARFTGVENGETTETERYSITEIRKQFDISTTLKGLAVKTVTLFEDNHVYKPEPRATAEITEIETAEPESENLIEIQKTEPSEEIETDAEEVVPMKPGDGVLLFLRKNAESGRMELTDYEGLKHLPRPDIAVYEARIKELGPILAAERPDPEKITDWLVMCAAEPATRWEGTYELQNSFYALERKREQEAEQKANAEGDKTEDKEEEGEFGWNGSGAEYAEAMNEFHRQTLNNIWLNAEFRGLNPNTHKKTLVPGDSELMSLVSRWADAQMAMLFLNQLRSEVYSPNDNAGLMRSVSAILKDKELERLAEKFGDVAYGDDNDEADEDELDDLDAASGEKGGDSKPLGEEASDEVEAPAETLVPETESETADESAETERPKKAPITCKQVREMIVARFVKRADAVIFQPDLAAAANQSPLAK